MKLKNIVSWGSFLIFIAVIGIWLYSCESDDSDKIITPEDPEEENTPDPNFNASDWILYRQ